MDTILYCLNARNSDLIHLFFDLSVLAVLCILVTLVLRGIIRLLPAEPSITEKVWYLQKSQKKFLTCTHQKKT